ncbi:MAG: DNA-directed RNA polymerase subunit omega [Paraclostridium sp.]
MIKPSINEVLNRIDNRYYLVVTVAKRAREIIDGATPYVSNKNKEIKPVTVATQEVVDQKINFRKLTEEEVLLQEAMNEAQQAQDTVEE